MESRVYDDEESASKFEVDQELETEKLSQPQKELKFKTDIGNALSAGAVFIQNVFEKVEVIKWILKICTYCNKY